MRHTRQPRPADDAPATGGSPLDGIHALAVAVALLIAAVLLDARGG